MSYFDRLYGESADPWDFAGRWYEARKRQLLLACLPRERFRSAFEPGCSTGHVTVELADRCDEVLATDVTDEALRTARSQVAGHPGVRVERLRVPDEWPPGRFELVVLSELAYYLDEDRARALGAAAAGSLTSDGVVVLCHWRHPVDDYPLSGDRAQELVRSSTGLAVQVSHVEEDFLLDVLVPAGAPSVAGAEGLLGPSRRGHSSP